MPGAPRVASVWRSEPHRSPQAGHDAVRRLTSREQFQATLAGPVVAKTEHFALHLLTLEALTPSGPPGSKGDARAVLFPGAGAWLGAMAPKRWARRAVTRNLIKRQIHHVSSSQQHLFAAAAHVVRLRAAFDPARFASASSKPLRKFVAKQLADLFTQAAPHRAAGAGR